MKTQNSYTTIRPNWDKLNSTFFWVIVLDPEHPDNSPGVKEMTGYSKAEGHDEAKNKEAMFTRKCVMLAQRGYLNKALNIELYMRRGDDMLNKNLAYHLFTINKKGFELGEDMKQNKVLYTRFSNAGVISFLHKFYQYLREGKDIGTLIPKNKTTFSKDDYLDPEKVKLKDILALSKYCERLISNKHPFEAVMSFYRKYEAKLVLQAESSFSMSS